MKSVFTGWLKEIACGIASFKRHSNSDFQFYSRSPAVFKDFNGTKTALRKHYETVLQLNNVDAGLIAGLYINTALDTWKTVVLAAEETINSIENVTIPFGIEFNDCSSTLMDIGSEKIIMGIQKLQFIACKVVPREHGSPEKQADQVLRTCNNLMNLIRRENISAQFFCRVAYPSGGVSPAGGVRSQTAFQLFWCRLFSKVGSFPLFMIIADSAFDDTPARVYKEVNAANLLNQYYHYGWWKRIDELTNSAASFVAKVDCKRILSL